ncbi:response regulator transcription factor [Puia sp.]|uniref:response regulator transcription factor n=1 Tax=Puia sp. TaxID=2045100 RepID=UPI002F3E83DE
MNQILLVEDDPAIAQLLNLHWHAPDYRVTVCTRVAAALERLRAETFDVMILDILLPDGNGIDLCRRIREGKNWTPVLMLSALSDESDKVQALESGADDYLTKPFGVAEMMARVRALLRRRQGAGEAVGDRPAGGTAGVGTTKSDKDGGGMAGGGTAGEPATGDKVIRFRDLVVDHHKRKVTMRGQRLELTPKEFDLLWLLAGHPGKTFSRHELLDMIWGFAFQEYEHTVTSHINRLRIKIEADLNKPEYILTTWGAGYRFAE